MHSKVGSLDVGGASLYSGFGSLNLSGALLCELLCCGFGGLNDGGTLKYLGVGSLNKPSLMQKAKLFDLKNARRFVDLLLNGSAQRTEACRLTCRQLPDLE